MSQYYTPVKDNVVPDDFNDEVFIFTGRDDNENKFYGNEGVGTFIKYLGINKKYKIYVAPIDTPLDDIEATEMIQAFKNPKCHIIAILGFSFKVFIKELIKGNITKEDIGEKKIICAGIPINNEPADASLKIYLQKDFRTLLSDKHNLIYYIGANDRFTKVKEEKDYAKTFSYSLPNVLYNDVEDSQFKKTTHQAIQMQVLKLFNEIDKNSLLTSDFGSLIRQKFDYQLSTDDKLNMERIASVATPATVATPAPAATAATAHAGNVLPPSGADALSAGGKKKSKKSRKPKKSRKAKKSRKVKKSRKARKSRKQRK